METAFKFPLHFECYGTELHNNECLWNIYHGSFIEVFFIFKYKVRFFESTNFRSCLAVRFNLFLKKIQNFFFFFY